jgi:hypothetical protein
MSVWKEFRDNFIKLEETIRKIRASYPEISEVSMYVDDALKRLEEVRELMLEAKKLVKYVSFT